MLPVTVTITASGLGEAKEVAANVAEAMVESGDYTLTKASARRIEVGRKIEMTFRQIER